MVDIFPHALQALTLFPSSRGGKKKVLKFFPGYTVYTLSRDE